MEEFAGIDNLEVLVLALLQKSRKKVAETPPSYDVMPADRGADMLQWKSPVQIQDITHGYWRVGAIGDGNCLLHSFMTAASPTYRMQNMTTRQYIVDEFRKVLMARMDAIRSQMDILYAEIGGAAALEDSLEIISVKRDEIGLEVAPAIARVYGFNFLAIGIDDGLKWRPYCQTFNGFDETMPTALIHYMGAGANFEERKHGFSEAGHYEAIIRPVMAESAKAKTKAKATDTLHLDEVRTSYMLTTGELAPILALFETECKGGGKYAHPLEREGGPRRTASGRIITGSAKTSSGSRSRKTVKRTVSGRTASGGSAKTSSGTRKRKTS